MARSWHSTDPASQGHMGQLSLTNHPFSAGAPLSVWRCHACRRTQLAVETVTFEILGEDQMKEKIKLNKQHLITWAAFVLSPSSM